MRDGTSPREEKSWPRWPLYLYYVVLLVAGMWYSRGDFSAPFPRTIFWFFVPPILYLAVAAVATGKVWANFSHVRRSRSPFRFWFLVALLFTMACALGLVGFSGGSTTVRALLGAIMKLLTGEGRWH